MRPMGPVCSSPARRVSSDMKPFTKATWTRKPEKPWPTSTPCWRRRIGWWGRRATRSMASNSRSTCGDRRILTPSKGFCRGCCDLRPRSCTCRRMCVARICWWRSRPPAGRVPEPAALCNLCQSKEFGMNTAASGLVRGYRCLLAPLNAVMARSLSCSMPTAFAVLLLAACGGGSTGLGPSPSNYTIGGTLSGLAAGLQVGLTDNGADSLTLTADGAYTFKTQIAAGGSYSVSVTAQPAGQICTVANSTGTNVRADVTTVNVSCAAQSLYAYVVNSGDNTVSQYTVGATGELTPMSTPIVATGTAPQSVVVDPLNRYAYVPNLNDNTVSQYTIGSGGLLVPMSPATVQTGVGPWAVAIDPTGSYAYVVNNVDRTVSQYTIGTGGTLVPMTPATISTGTQPWGITIDPTGQYAYVANHVDNTVSQYAVGAGGALTQLSPSTVVSGVLPSGIAINPAGLYAYVANLNDNTVSQYTIGTGGVLTPQSPAIVATGTQPRFVAVNPNGQGAYVVNSAPTGSGTISQYTIGAAGLLTPMPAPTVATGQGPVWITVDRAGQYAYATNITDNTVSQFAINSDGSLTALSTPIVTT